MKLREKKFEDELQFYRQGLVSKDGTKIRHHLGRAHVLSQNSTPKHLYVHVLMFGYALRTFDVKEIFGQLLRLVVTVPGHLIGRVPRGNIGWSTVGLTQVMQVPEDLESVLTE